MGMNPWHDVEIGEKAPEIVTAIVEIPKGSRLKYELDKETGMLRLDDVLHSAVHYPINYGFIPRTMGDDGDPLDILVLSVEPIHPLTIFDTRVLGAFLMEKSGEEEYKIFGVHSRDPDFSHIKSIDDIPHHQLVQIRQFFRDYKRLEKQKGIVKKTLDKKQAYGVIEDARHAYLAKAAA
jgi:inorganic pyrophosphatase